jgi:murein L,D-transpeptidase YcbB/YkuD
MAAATSRRICAWPLAVCILVVALSPPLYAGDPPAALQSRLEHAISRERSSGLRRALAKFYQLKSWALVWQKPDLAQTARATLASATDQGLPAGQYLSAVNPGIPSDADVQLSAQLLRYARDVSEGFARPADAGLPARSLETIAVRLAAATRSSAELRQYLATLPPDHAAYRTLKRAYARYRLLATQGGWPQLPAVRRISLHVPGPLLDQVRSRLACEYSSLRDANIETLRDAVRRFQSHVGLPADGIIGPKTISALNVEPRARAAQIAANMERWRWMPRHFPARYIEVNTASTILQAIAHGVTVLHTRVIVGKAATPTPDFVTQALAIIVNPVWEVPHSIVQKEILPRLRRQPNYLSQNRMIMKNGSVRQLPGADNALGRIKIDITDPFSIYMHDTPARALFAQEQRHLSHGCIRVEKILPLASWLLTGSLDEETERLQTAIADGTTHRIALSTPVTVYIVYQTATVGPDGTVDFVPDAYGLDWALISALFGTHPLPGTTKGAASHGCRTAK